MRGPSSFTGIVVAMLAGFGMASAADDQAACFRGSVDDENVAACSRLIESSTGGALAQAYVRRAFLLVRRGREEDFDHAIADAGETLRLQPDYPFALAIRAASYVRKGDLDRALSDLNKGLRLAPQDNGIHQVFGTYYFARGDNNRALAELNEALRLNPNNNFSYRSRGLVYESTGELDKALADFRRALRGDPGKKELVGREAAEGIGRVELKLAALAEQSNTSVSPKAGDSNQIGAPARRVALVIGNARYPDDPTLTQPAQHARNIADELRKSGYEVDTGENLTKQGLQRALETFKSKIAPGSVALVFFSGFGIQAGRQTYLLPIDAQIWVEADVARDGFKLETLLADLHEKGASAKVAIIDASRRNPFERRFRGGSIGLAPVTTPPGSLVIYAAAPGQVARDDSGLFVTELTKEIRAPAVNAEEAFIRTRIGVSSATKGQQIPWISSSLTSALMFAQSGK
jgi:tetratricopeptide (TPR) repeat protein